MFWRITFPLLLPGIIAAALLSFALSFDDFIITNFNAGAAVTFPKYVYTAASRGIPAEANVVASAVFLIAIIGVVISQVAAGHPAQAPARRQRHARARTRRAARVDDGRDHGVGTLARHDARAHEQLEPDEGARRDRAVEDLHRDGLPGGRREHQHALGADLRDQPGLARSSTAFSRPGPSIAHGWARIAAGSGESDAASRPNDRARPVSVMTGVGALHPSMPQCATVSPA